MAICHFWLPQLPLTAPVDTVGRHGSHIHSRQQDFSEWYDDIFKDCITDGGYFVASAMVDNTLTYMT